MGDLNDHLSFSFDRQDLDIVSFTCDP